MSTESNKSKLTGQFTIASRSQRILRVRPFWAFCVTLFLLCAGAAAVILQALRSEQLDHDLMLAVRRNDPNLVGQLLLEGASADTASSSPVRNPFFAFVVDLRRIRDQRQSVEPPLIVALTIEPAETDPMSRNPAKEVIQKKIRIVRLLLARRPNVNVRNRFGRLAVSVACWEDYDFSPQFAQLLVAGGADVNLEDETIRFANTAETPSPFRAAVRDNLDPSLIQRMLDHGAAVNSADRFGQTSLMMCSSPAIMGLLLARHPNLDQCDSNGLTALDYGFPRLSSARRSESDATEERNVAAVRRMLQRAGAHHGHQLR